MQSDSAGRLPVLTPGIVAGFVLLLTILVGTLIIGLANLRNLYFASEAVAHSYSVKFALNELLLAAVDAETGERGFVITGETPYLGPYDAARTTIAPRFTQARTLVADNTQQRADLDALSAAMDQKLNGLAEAIHQRRENGLAAAQAVVATNVGRRTMDGMRSIVARMDAREDVLLAARTAEAAQNYRTAVVTRFLTTIIAIAAVIALFWGTRQFGVHRAEAERIARMQEAAVRETLQLKDEFVALVSHELRTPANTIAGWARVLEHGAMSSDGSAKALAAINRSADSLRQLLDDLLDSSQLVAGRMHLKIDAVDVCTVVQEAIEAVRLSAENKGIALTSNVSPSAPPVVTRGDGSRLKQVAWNLLTNAIKFTPDGGRVTVDLTSSNRGVQLEVRDTGDGVDPAFLPHMFDRFRQAAPSRTGQQGLGLGLAIVRHLVELHGGTVSAHSDGLGSGTTFTIDLPSMPAFTAESRWSEISRA